MVLALAAGRTRAIGLGPASLVPSLRHPMVTAAALATLAGLAPGRVSTAFGTGLTGRMLLGERPCAGPTVEEYVAPSARCCAVEEASWNGSLVRLPQPPGFAARRPADVAVLIAADGPRGRAVAAGLGDGVVTARVPRHQAGPDSRQVLLTFGTVLDEGEDAACPRAVAAAGPALAAAYHAIYESKGAGGVDQLPGGSEWREAVEAVEAPRRHFAVHDGHLIALGQHDETLLARAAPLLAELDHDRNPGRHRGPAARAGPGRGHRGRLPADGPGHPPRAGRVRDRGGARRRGAGRRGGEGRMTTLVRLAKRDPGSGIDDFRSQTGVASDWSSAVRYGLRGATQAMTLPGAYRRGEPACDLIDELVFDDEASVAGCQADPAFQCAWWSPLLDAASVACLVVEEHVAKPGPVAASFVKNYELVTKRPDMDRAEFDRYWAQVHGPLAATIPTIRRYVQAHLSPGTRQRRAPRPTTASPSPGSTTSRRCGRAPPPRPTLRPGRRGELPRGRAPVRDHHRADHLPAAERRLASRRGLLLALF